MRPTEDHQLRNKDKRWSRRAVLDGAAAGAAALVAARMAFARAPGSSQTNSDVLGRFSPEQRANYEKMHARMMAALKYERVTVSGGEALAEWERLRVAGRGWPVVIGGDEDLERIADQFSMDDQAVAGSAMPGVVLHSPEQILANAAAIRFPQDFSKWPGAYQPGDLRAPIGEWPKPTHTQELGLTVASDLVSGTPIEKVHILLIPARAGWEVPAFLRWGDWNACPPPEYHVAALRRWHERFGAELIGINGDTLNLRVANPPRSRVEAIALARELYGFCPDIVDQGVGTISALAASLTASQWWYLWWD